MSDSAAADKFAVHVRYLTGYCCAAESGTGRAEWPPHPARLFMALVAACYATGGDGEELAALQWLEKLNPPTLFAGESDARSNVQVFVPVNDRQTPRDAGKVADAAVFAAMRALPQHRDRKERSFARTWLHDDTATFVWPSPLDHAAALTRLCGKVARLGHSSSLVQVWIGDPPGFDDPRQRYEPTGGRLKLRVTNDGTLKYLDDLYGAEARTILDAARSEQAALAATSAELKAKRRGIKGKGAQDRKAEVDLEIADVESKRQEVPAPRPPRRPEVQVTAGYAVAGEAAPDGPHTVFDPRFEVLVLSPHKTTFRRLPASRGPRTCEVLRRALLEKFDGRTSELVTGHDADGRPSRRPHLAIFPMPDVGATHAQGHLLGLGVALPRDATVQERSAVVAALDDIPSLTLGDLGTWNLLPATASERRRGLLTETWAKPAAQWATVTPIALDRHPKAKDAAAQQEELAGLIRVACEQIGLVGVRAVVPFPVSPHLGAPPGHAYPRLARKDGGQRRQTHAMIWLEEPVAGPVLLGAGRYRGWGVCRPFTEGGAS